MATRKRNGSARIAELEAELAAAREEAATTRRWLRFAKRMHDLRRDERNALRGELEQTNAGYRAVMQQRNIMAVERNQAQWAMELQRDDFGKALDELEAARARVAELESAKESS